MIKIEWRDEFKLGIESIDFEHKSLITEINQALEIIQTEPSSVQTQGFLGSIYAHISAHFALEEVLMRDHAYVHYHKHKDSHEDLLDDIRDMMDDYAFGDYDQKLELFAESVHDWFVLHFKSHDAALHSHIPHN